jgi:hypothetical protein
VNIADIPSTTPRPFVFVLMPFASHFDDVYRLGIKPACENAGAYAERVDEQIFHDSILQRVYNQIAKADLVVADLSGKNPNVFYETGYAHALGKPVILLTQSVDDIPFDLKHYPHVVYGGRIVDLLPELEKRVRYLLDAPTGSPPPATTLRVRVNGASTDAPTVLQTTFKHSALSYPVAVEIHNSAERAIHIVDCQLGIVSAFDVTTNNAESIRLSDDLVLHLRRDFIQILPGAWHREKFWFALEHKGPGPVTRQFTVRIFTPSGYYDFQFSVVYDVVADSSPAA